MRKPPKAIGAILPEVLKQCSQAQGRMQEIRRAWKRMVGPRLAAHTRPLSLRRGRLVVAVEQPGDGFELNYLRPRLLEQLKAMSEGDVDDIILRPHGLLD